MSGEGEVSILQMLLDHEANMHPAVRESQKREAEQRYYYHHPEPKRRRPSQQNKPLRREKKRGGVLVDNGQPPVTLADVT